MPQLDDIEVDEEYQKSRQRLEEIKNEELASDDHEMPKIEATEELPIVDVEKENKAFREKHGESKNSGEHKQELDSRLKKAAEEAKAKGKRTIRTFDMLRKAISGDAEQVK